MITKVAEVQPLFFLPITIMDKEKLETAVAAMLAESGFEITDFKMLRQNGKPLLQFFVDRVTPPPACPTLAGSAGLEAGGGATLALSLSSLAPRRIRSRCAAMPCLPIASTLRL